MPENPPAHRRASWWGVGAMFALAASLAAPLALGVYRFQTVVRHSEADGLPVFTTPIGPEWLRGILGNSAKFALERPYWITLELSTTRHSRARIDSIIWSLSGLRSIKFLDLRGDGVTNAAVSKLQSLQQMTSLCLQGTSLTATGLEVLAHLPNLESLTICKSETVDDQAVLQIARASQITYLGLDETALTDAGLLDLGKMAQLKSLSLNNTAVTDAGLLHLRGLTQLKSLSVSNTGVTDAGIDALRRELPELEVLDD